MRVEITHFQNSTAYMYTLVCIHLAGYQSEAIKVVAGDFKPGMISKLVNQTLYRMATAYFEAKKKANQPL